MNDEYNFYEEMKATVDYLRDTNYELWEKLSEHILNGKGGSEIILEAAVEISFDRNMSNSAILLVRVYEDEMLNSKGYYYPFVVQSVREMILRNMINRESNSSNKCLYAIKMSNETVKIGIATDINRRFSQIKASSGMNIEKAIYTKIFDYASREETGLHRKYKGNRLHGEYFSIPFDNVVQDIKRIARNNNIDVTIA